MALKCTLISALLIVFVFIAMSATTSAEDGDSGDSDAGDSDPDNSTASATVTPGATSASVTPGATSASVTPGATSATVTPGATSASVTPGATSASVTPGATSASVTPGVTNSSGTQTTRDSNPTKPPLTVAPDPCVPGRCGSGSTCENRGNRTFICLCLPGDSYNPETSSCVRAKVFPGQLTLDKAYDVKMEDKTSEIFRDTSNEITSTIDKVFKEGENKETYSHSIVLELRNAPVAARNSKVDASIEIIFKASSNINDGDVKDQMAEKVTCTDCPLKGSSFAAKNLCDLNACNEKTTTCTPEGGSFTCTCANGYIPTEFSNRVCIECPSGEKAQDSKCVPCAFGHTGFNCSDNRLFATVIAASVLGALLLIALILLPIMALKSKKKSSKSKNEDIGKPYVSHSFPKAPQVNSSMHNGHSSSFHGAANGGGANVGAPRIPRATTTNDWDSRTNLEMTPSNSRQNLIPSGRNSRLNDDQDEMFTFGQSRPQNNPYDQIGGQKNPYDQIGGQKNPYDQIGGQKNPYAQNRAINPYAQSRGNTNPYYM